MAQKKVINPLVYARYKREIDALYTMGYRYDMEKNPEKKAKLEKEIIKRCDKLKPKLGLKDISDEDARKMLGVSFDSSNDETEEHAAISEPAVEETEEEVRDENVAGDGDERV